MQLEFFSLPFHVHKYAREDPLCGYKFGNNLANDKQFAGSSVVINSLGSYDTE